MTRKMLIVNSGLVAAVATGAALAGVSLGQPGSGSASAAIQTATVQRGVVQSLVSGTGNLQSPANVSVNFTSGGLLKAVYVHAGEKVKAGQPLAEIEPTSASNQLASALSGLASAKAQLEQTEQGLTPAQLRQDAISTSQAQQSVVTAKQSNTADLATLRAAVTQARTTLTMTKRTAAASARSSALLVAQARAGVPNAVSTARQDAVSSQQAVDQAQQSLADAEATVAQNEISYQNAVDQANSQLAYDQTNNSQNVTTLRSDQNAVTSALQNQASGKLKDQQSIESAQNAVTSALNSQTAQQQKDAQSIASAKASLDSALNSESSQRIQSAQSVTNAESSLMSAVRSLQSGQVKDGQSLKSAQMSLESTRAANAVKEAPAQAGTLASAQASVDNAQMTVTSDRLALAETTLRAPIDGTVAAVNSGVGEYVSGGGAVASNSSSSSSSGSSGSASAFITLADLQGLQITVGFSEADAVKIRVDQPATVSLSALPTQKLAAHVIAINPIAAVVNNVVTYTVTFALDRTTAGARPGMTATIDVVTAERDNVLNVPSSALQTAGGSQFVTVMNGKNQVQTPVTAGLQGDTTTEITSGVKAGQQVVLQVATVSAAAAGTGTTGTGRGGFPGGGLGGFGGGGFPRGGG